MICTRSFAWDRWFVSKWLVDVLGVVLASPGPVCLPCDLGYHQAAIFFCFWFQKICVACCVVLFGRIFGTHNIDSQMPQKCHQEMPNTHKNAIKKRVNILVKFLEGPIIVCGFIEQTDCGTLVSLSCHPGFKNYASRRAPNCCSLASALHAVPRGWFPAFLMHIDQKK